MNKQMSLVLPKKVRQAARQGNTGDVAKYIQSVNTTWTAVDCYRAAATIVDKSKGKKR